MTEFNFRKILSHVLNPYLFVAYPQPSVKEKDGYEYPKLQPAAGDDIGSDEYDSFSAMSRDEALEVLRVNALGHPMAFPLEVKIENGDWWLLPMEPLITITGKNILVKKQVSKGTVRGSIKERWSQDDYGISIEGILINTESNSYPDQDVIKLRRHLEAGKLEVRCPLFELFSINQIVVETWEVPATTGIRNQAYKISALSDDIYKLLLRHEDLKQQ